MDSNRSFRDSVIRAVALIGLLLVLMLGAWGIILLAFNLPTIMGNVGGSIVGLFSSPATTTTATSTTTVVVTKPVVTKPVVTNTTPVTTTQPVTTYVPAQQVPQLYGNPDLAVRIISATPTTPIYNQGYQQAPRVNVKFEVTNVGTNVAPAGWVLTANLPVGYTYLYTSNTQQALNPGDKIVFTLGFNSANQNQYCTQQYPNQNCPWYQAPYQAYPYQGTCYRYDGYQNTPVACTDSDGNPIYTNPNYNSAYNNNNYGYTYQGNLVTITIDPRNWIYDMNRGNNTASIASPTY